MSNNHEDSTADNERIAQMQLHAGEREDLMKTLGNESRMMVLGGLAGGGRDGGREGARRRRGEEGGRGG